jgi:hypothetical protein
MPSITITARSAALAALTLMALPVGARHEIAPDSASKQCISRHGIRDESAETDSHLIFHAGGSKAYRNYLPEPCDGLGHINNISRLRLKSADPDKLCQGDTVEILDHDGALGIGGDPLTTRCALGPFEAITEMSLSESLRR